MENLKTIAMKALDANPTVLERIQSAPATGQYKAVGSALASAVAKRASVDVNRATWVLVNAANVAREANEEINVDF